MLSNDLAGSIIDIICHIGISFLVGFLVLRYATPRINKHLWKYLAAAFITGVLIDLDHLIDYFLAFGSHFQIVKFFSGAMFSQTHTNYVLFHGYEYVIVLAIIWFFMKQSVGKSLVLAALLSMAMHLATDILLFGINPMQYSLIYRFLRGFQA